MWVSLLRGPGECRAEQWGEVLHLYAMRRESWLLVVFAAAAIVWSFAWRRSRSMRSAAFWASVLALAFALGRSDHWTVGAGSISSERRFLWGLITSPGSQVSWPELEWIQVASVDGQTNLVLKQTGERARLICSASDHEELMRLWNGIAKRVGAEPVRNEQRVLGEEAVDL